MMVRYLTPTGRLGRILADAAIIYRASFPGVLKTCSSSAA
jgi:hypothetical protein